MHKKIILITGGARSGKSIYALKNASKISGDKAYLATAEALDEEMRKRIENHKKQRGRDWDTYEEPLRIAEIIKEIEDKYTVIIVDCLTLWLSNIMHSKFDISYEMGNLIDTLSVTHHTSRIYIVSNEVGMGIIPKNDMARKFRDMAGFLNQRVAEIAHEVYLLISGIPFKVKG